MSDVKVRLSERAALVKQVLESNADTLTMTQAEKTKLAGVQVGATANQTNAQLLDRANHTGSQAISTVTGLQTALDSKAGTGTVWPQSQVSGLQAALATLANKPEAFSQLLDTPAGYAGQAGKAVIVNPSENGLTFGNAPGGGGVSGEEVSISQMMDDLKIKKVSPTLFHELPSAGTILAYMRIPTDMRITGVAVIADSGSGTVTIAKNGVNLTGLVGQTITTVMQTHTATGTGSDNVLVEGDELRVTIPTSSSLMNVRVYPLIERRA